MEKAYRVAFDELGISSEIFDCIVFSSKDAEGKIVECLQHCLDNVPNLRLISTVLLQYIVDRKEAKEKQAYIKSVSSDTGHGNEHFDANNKLPYGIAEGMGIETEGMTPKEVWEALKGKGITPKDVFGTISKKDRYVNQSAEFKEGVASLQETSKECSSRWIKMQAAMTRLSGFNSENDAGYEEAAENAEKAKKEFIKASNEFKTRRADFAKEYPDDKESILGIGHEHDVEYENESDVLSLDEEIKAQKSVVSMYEEQLTDSFDRFVKIKEALKRKDVGSESRETLEAMAKETEEEISRYSMLLERANDKLDFLNKSGLEIREEATRSRVPQEVGGKSNAHELARKLYSGEATTHADFINAGNDIMERVRKDERYKAYKEKQDQIAKLQGERQAAFHEIADSRKKIGISSVPRRDEIEKSDKLSPQEKETLLTRYDEMDQIEKQIRLLKQSSESGKIVKDLILQEVFSERGESKGFPEWVTEEDIKKHFKGNESV